MSSKLLTVNFNWFIISYVYNFHPVCWPFPAVNDLPIAAGAGHREILNLVYLDRVFIYTDLW